MNSLPLWKWPATRQAAAIRDKEITSEELIASHLRRIEDVNPEINALVYVDSEGAMEQARSADEKTASGSPLGPLHGLPIAIKDLDAVAGMPLTYGSLAYRDNVADEDCLLVTRVKNAGAIVIGKSNTPEFGTGGHTNNQVYGATRNPYDPTKSVGGSSGGAAAALAVGMVPLANGSDLGGSLRNPASFCNVVGLRPSAGRVPTWPDDNPWFTLAVDGPMARNAKDVALLMQAIAGYEAAIPTAMPGDGAEFAESLEIDLAAVRVGWTSDFGGLEIDPAITRVLESDGRAVLKAACAELHTVKPNFDKADETFRTLRAAAFAAGHASYVAEHRESAGKLLVENTEAGLDLSAADMARAQRQRFQLYSDFLKLFENADIIAGPTVSVPPFPIDQDWVYEINGVKQSDYLEWMRTTWYVTLTGMPCISIPCGFTENGLPVGLQLVAPIGREMLLLRVANAFRRLSRTARNWPM